MDSNEINIWQLGQSSLLSPQSVNFSFPSDDEHQDFADHASMNTISISVSGTSATAISASEPNAVQQDYFLLDVVLNIASAAGVHHDSDTERGPCLRRITFSASPLNNSVQTYQSIPSTFSGTTSHTDSINGSIGTSAGFFGDDPNAGVSGNVGFSHSTTYQCPDMTVSNLSSGSEVKWEIMIAEPQPVKGDTLLGEMCDSSTSTVAPEFCWVWTRPASSRQGASFQFQVTAICTYLERKVKVGGSLGPVPVAPNFEDVEYDSAPVQFTVSLNYASLPKSPA